MDGQQTCSVTGKDNRTSCSHQSLSTAHMLQPVLLQGSQILWNGLPHMRTQKYTSGAILNLTSWWEWVRSHDLKISDGNTAVAVWFADAKRRGLCCGERHWTALKKTFASLWWIHWWIHQNQQNYHKVFLQVFFRFLRGRKAPDSQYSFSSPPRPESLVKNISLLVLWMFFSP